MRATLCGGIALSCPLASHVCWSSLYSRCVVSYLSCHLGFGWRQNAPNTADSIICHRTSQICGRRLEHDVRLYDLASVKLQSNLFVYSGVGWCRLRRERSSFQCVAGSIQSHPPWACPFRPSMPFVVLVAARNACAEIPSAWLCPPPVLLLSSETAVQPYRSLSVHPTNRGHGGCKHKA